MLFGLVVYLYGVMAFVDHFRGAGPGAGGGAGFRTAARPRIFSDVLNAARQPALRSRPDPLMRDFSTVQTFLS